MADDDLPGLMHRLVDAGPAGLDELPPPVGPEDHPALVAPVVAEHDCVNGQIRRVLHEGQVQVRQPVKDFLEEVLVQYGVCSVENLMRHV